MGAQTDSRRPFKVALFRTSERRAIQLAARELGHGLQTRTQAELATVRRELSDVVENASDEYTRGFLDAIEHLLAGTAAEGKHRRAVEESVASARLRKNATKVLHALHAGCTLPSEVAEETGLKLPTVSNELAALEDEDLVERLERAAAEDQRTSPRALTVRGMRIADYLTRTHASPVAEAARDLAPVFVAFMNQLADESYLAPRRLEEVAIEHLGAVNGRFVCAEFMRHAEHRQAISYTSSAVTLTSPFYRRRLRDLLQEALSLAQAPFLEPMKQLAGSAAICLRTTTAMRDHWQMALSFHRMRNVYAWSRDDVRADQLPAPPGPYHVVWENPEVLTRDLGDRNLRVLLSKATRKLCYVATDVQLPQGVERIELDAHHVRG